MNCRDVQERMAEYIAGELPEEWAARISSHLPTCRECALWHAEVREGLQEWENPGILPETCADVPDLVPQVMARLRLLAAEGCPVAGERQEAEERAVGEDHPDARLNNRTELRQAMGKSAFYHYAVAASLAFLMLRTGVFQRLAAGIGTFNVHVSEQMQGLFQLFSHL